MNFRSVKLYQIVLIKFIIIFLCIVNSKIIQLHNEMNENELKFYFGVIDYNDIIPEYDIVDLNLRIKRNADNKLNEERTLAFQAFESFLNLKLRKNPVLISPHMKIVYKLSDRDKILNNSRYEVIDDNCFFLSKTKSVIAAINNCDNKNMSGLIITSDAKYEILPLSDNLKIKYGNYKSPHLIKKLSTTSFEQQDNNKLEYELWNDISNHHINIDLNNNLESQISNKLDRNVKQSDQKILTIEMGVFFDETAYQIFAPFFNYDERSLRNMILAYMNNLQAIFLQPSLGVPIEISIVYLEIMRRQPNDFNHFNGDLDYLSNSFCEYQRKKNTPLDNNPSHWDMGILLSGLDFYNRSLGDNIHSPLGLASVNGICTTNYSCPIAEFGPSNLQGSPYPTASFNSIYVLAHEIGHILGMEHDSVNNSCFGNNNIMSAFRPYEGASTWSSCSANIARNLFRTAPCLTDSPSPQRSENDAWRYNGYPGVVYTAKRQCEIFLLNENAIDHVEGSNSTICESLQCYVPGRTGVFLAGPALYGTNCGTNRYCYDGKCLSISEENSKLLPKVPKGYWSPWIISNCESKCLINSKGIQTRNRNCINNEASYPPGECTGSSFEIILCDDRLTCQGKWRSNINTYTNTQCKLFSSIIYDLDPTASGIQAEYQPGRKWMSCALYCKRRFQDIFYSPIFEVDETLYDTYLPDGTWCHTDGKRNYYCQNHYCLPESMLYRKFNSQSLAHDNLVIGNARIRPLDERMKNYLSIDRYGRPVLSDLDIADLNQWYKQENHSWFIDNTLTKNYQ